MNTKTFICAACPVDQGACPQCGTFWQREGEKRIGWRSPVLTLNIVPTEPKHIRSDRLVFIPVEQNENAITVLGDLLLRLLGICYIGWLLVELLRWLGGLFK